VSHDRYFLEHVTNRTIELNRCYPQGILTCEGSLSRFVEQREQFLLGQEEQERALKGIVRDEIDWLRRSPKARTTKSQSRIDRAHELIGELSELKQRNKKERVDIDFASSERTTRKLIVAKNVSKSLGGKHLFKGIDITLSPGKCLGIVGANGTGKPRS
jgi:ATP-binding cassette subfamily F protein uup